jgi:hypothetical protein
VTAPSALAVIVIERCGTSGAEFWTAVGTVGAVIVALGAVTVPGLVRRCRRPRLEIGIGEQEPLLRPSRPEGITTEAVLLRIAVSNAGRLEARRVRGQVTKWWSQRNERPEARHQWIEYDIDPMTYPWVSAPPADGDSRAAFLVDLAHEASDYLEIIRYDTRAGQVRLVAPDRRQRPFLFEANYHLVEHRVEILVGAENASVVRKVISFKASHENFISDVKFSEPPPPERTLRGGLFNILRSEQAGQDDTPEPLPNHDPDE